MKRVFGQSIVAILFGSGVAFGTIHNGTVDLDGFQETPPVATPAYGTGTVTYDDVTKELSWNVSYTGLIGSFTAAHFHGPAAPGVGPAAVTVPIPGFASPLIGGPVVLTAAQETELLANLWYVNIHSTFRPGGEIRGQVLIPEPAAGTLLAIGALGLIRRRRVA